MPHIPRNVAESDVFLYEDSDDGKNVVGRVRLPTGMAAVVPAWKLGELLEDPERVKPERETAEAAAAERQEGDAVMYDAAPGTDSEYERFEDLARGPAQTSKPRKR